MRGSLHLVIGRVMGCGSIPACAGKPKDAPEQIRAGRVYPRVCGEAQIARVTLIDSIGLSPRVRGSQPVQRLMERWIGSIPACAGKPATRHQTGLVAGVYPRVCGEALTIRSRRSVVRGLSPRVRGSRTRLAYKLGGTGSIPACAGKPSPVPEGDYGEGVYPRVCGEAVSKPKRETSGGGLSPRVRGSPYDARATRLRGGSIPACAGKPKGSEQWVFGHRVYPRVCGEASVRWSRVVVIAGLSPRVRGSRCFRI